MYVPLQERIYFAYVVLHVCEFIIEAYAFTMLQENNSHHAQYELAAD